MTGKFWSDDAVAEVRKRAKMGFTYAEIAEFLGTTRSAVESLVSKRKLFTKAEQSANRSVRMTGQKLSAKTRRRRAENMRKVWADEQHRIARCARRKEVCRSPQARAQLDRARKAAIRKRRGGIEIPDGQIAADYAFFTRTKRLPAPMAAELAGAIPIPPATTRGT